jgi:hypothetical protein
MKRKGRYFYLRTSAQHLGKKQDHLFANMSAKGANVETSIARTSCRIIQCRHFTTPMQIALL